MSSGFNQFIGSLGLKTASREDLAEELAARQKTINRFPLEVFHPAVKPFIECLHLGYDIPESFIGLTLLLAYSSAIGTAYTSSTNGHDHMYLPIWGCNLGISSSGKSMVMKHILEPLEHIQEELSDARKAESFGLTPDKTALIRLKRVVFRDSHVPTLVNTVLVDNPKGVTKIVDELVEWTNSFNQLSKSGDGADDQFWLTTWNCSNYTAIRANRKIHEVPRPFVNVMGGGQYKTISKVFAKDRDSSGFVFRMLFARTNEDKISYSDPGYSMPVDFRQIHWESIRILYNMLPVHEHEDTPKRCVFERSAVKAYDAWCKKHIVRINAMESREDKSLEAGVFGKIREYVIRFAAILVLADKALSGKIKATSNASDPFMNSLYNDVFSSGDVFTATVGINEQVINRALLLGDYFMISAIETYEFVSKISTAPAYVLQLAALMKAGKTPVQIADFLFNASTDKPKERDAYRKRVGRDIKKYILEYPKVFNAAAK